MGIVERINSVLDYKVELNFKKAYTSGELNLDKRINRNYTLALIGLIIILLNAAGFYIGKEWFWVQNKSFYENRIGSLKQVLKENPGAKEVQVEIATTNYLNGNSEKAINQLREVLRKEPNNSNAQFLLGVILTEEKVIDESIVLLNNYVQKNNGLETRIAYLCLGQNYLAAEKYELALQNLTTAAGRDPGNPVVYYYLGRTYEKLQNRKQAIRAYEKALEINSSYVEADRALTSLIKKAHNK